MKKFMLLGAMVAMVIAALSIPALAQDRFLGEDRAFGEDYYEDLWGSFEDRFEDSQGWDAFEERFEDGFEEQGFSVFADDFEEEGFFFGDDRFEDGFFFDDDRFEEDFDEDFDGGGSAGVSQSFEQEAESGDVNQSFEVSNSGDNSNQCVGINGTANTGNAQNQIGVIQYGSEADDFEFEDSGASINVGGSSTTTCDQQVNQAAAAG